MKPSRLIIPLLACLLALHGACSAPSKSAAGLMKGVKTSVVYDTLFDIAGQRVNNHRTITSAYDTAGNLISEKTEFNNGVWSDDRQRDMTYNAQGKLLSLKTTAPGGQVLNIITITYAADGKTVAGKVTTGGDGRVYEVFLYKPTGTPGRQARYSYAYSSGDRDTALTAYTYTDAEGRLVKEEHVDSRGKVMSYATRSYTAGGQMAGLTAYDEEGKPEHSETHEYNGRSEEVKITVTEKRGDVKRTTTREYEARSPQGHWTLMKSTVDGRVDEVLHRRLTYY